MNAAKPELCVCEITPAFELSCGTISHHLKTLRETGLVGCERRGTYVYYWCPARGTRSAGGSPVAELIKPRPRDGRTSLGSPWRRIDAGSHLVGRAHHRTWRAMLGWSG